MTDSRRAIWAEQSIAPLLSIKDADNKHSNFPESSPSELCAHCRGKRQVAVVGRVRANGRWYTRYPIVFDSVAGAQAYLAPEKVASCPGGELINVIVPANLPWLGWPLLMLRMLIATVRPLMVGASR